jgi:hypothetical protein
MNWPERSLFGGAITCHLPPEWYDLSTIRPVPDHQECFCYDDLPNHTTSMWVIEIFQRHDDVDDGHIAQYLFHELALANDSERESTTSSFQSDDDAAALWQGDATVVRRSGSGIQRIRPGSGDRSPEHMVAIELLVLRLPQHSTDVLVTLSAQLLPTRHDGMDISRQRQEQRQIFQQIISTIQIRDYTLFQG